MNLPRWWVRQDRASRRLEPARLSGRTGSGRILFDGRDVAHLGDVERSRTRNHHIGFIFQSFNLVPVLDVFENVELPLLLHSGLSPAERRARVEQALADVSLLEFRKHWPDKLSGDSGSGWRWRGRW